MALKCMKRVRQSALGHYIHTTEHMIYGVTYLMIGFTDLHLIYYLFGGYVLMCVAIGEPDYGTMAASSETEGE